MNFRIYWPVAVTSQVTVRVKVDGAGNDGVTKMPALRLANGKLADGHILGAVELQLTVVQFRPADGVSRTTASGAASGPELKALSV